MIPLSLFLLGLFVVYVGTVRAAFTAMLSLSVRFIVERHARGDSLAEYLEDPDRLFVPARLLLGIASVAAALLLASAIGVDGSRRLATFAAVMLLFGVGCEHFLPQLIVRKEPQAVLEFLLPSFDVLVAAVAPVSSMLVGDTPRVDRESPDVDTDEAGEPGSVDDHDETKSEEESPDEHRLIQSVVDFGDRLVREVMTPRPDIVGIEADETIDDLRRLFQEQEYSRIPVYRDNLDNIVGFVFVKDLLKLDVAAVGGQAVTSIMRTPYLVPETKRVPELLKEFQRQQVQCAIVVDEYGGTAGLVTAEDLLEEIVGEIRDEYDVEADPIVDEGDGVFVFSGKVNFDELCDRLGVQIEGEGFETVGGYLLTKVGRVPTVGERFDLDGLHLEVVEVERRRIKRVRVRVAEPSEQEAGA